MQLTALRRWHWIAIAVIVGFLIGFARASNMRSIYGLDMSGYGMLMTDQRQFESALVGDYNGIPLFSDPVVYPHWTTDAAGNNQLVYIVSGRYWNGQAEEKDGKTVGEWLPRCFIAQTPYRPGIGVAEGNAPAVSEYPSVVQFLAALHRVYGIKYRYAWWAAYPVLSWVTGCVILVGGVWPTLINLLAFGTFTRPPEAKALSLWSIRMPKTPALAKSPTIDFGPTEDVSEVPDTAPTEAETAVASPPIANLANQPLDAAPPTPHSSAEFDAKPDDFYPTERRGPARQENQSKAAR